MTPTRHPIAGQLTIRIRFSAAGCAAFLFMIVVMAVRQSAAQDADAVTSIAMSADVCAPEVTQLWTAATSACINKPEGYLCNGGTPPDAEPSGAVETALGVQGSLVAVNEIDAVRLPPIDTTRGQAGVLYLRLAAPIAATVLALGEITLRDVSPPDFPAWQSLVLQTGTVFPACGAAPLSVAVVQAPLGTSARIVINGASLSTNGAVLIHTTERNTIFVALSGLAAVTTFGQETVFYSGQQITIGHAPGDFSAPQGPPSAAVPFDSALTRYLPVSLFDRPLVLPQPGTVVTQGAVNLRSQPDITSGVITQIPNGEILSVLGRTPDGEWYNVRRTNGDTGWMSSDLLLRNIGAIEAVYAATPVPPQRYGEFGTQGRVIAANGVNMRRGPDAVFPAIATLSAGTAVNLVARSPYSPWIKIETGGVEGWVALVNVETQAFLEALPIDFNAPALPPPTAVPGSFGNAFPDPNRDGN
ncbi:MAG: SH3 domain-containing protein [bacterium]|nr:SH3 domain-containing protein [bacterium]